MKTQTASQIASRLSTAEMRNEASGSGDVRFAPAVAGLCNLFFCAYMDQYIRKDSTGQYFTLFMFAECSVVALVCCGIMVRSMSTIISRTRVFPVPASSYLRFIWFGFAKRGAIISLFMSTALFLIILRAGSLISLAVCVLFLVLAFAEIQLFIAVISLKLLTSSQPVAVLGVMTIYTVLAVVGASLLLNVNSPLHIFPIVSWAVNGMAAAAQRDTLQIVLNMFYFATTSGALVLFGRTIR